jgi:hypothetical protein
VRRASTTRAARQLVDIGVCGPGKIFLCTVGMHRRQGVCTRRTAGHGPEGATPSTPHVTNYVWMYSVQGAAIYEGVAQSASMLPRPSCPSSTIIIANNAWYVLKVNAHIVTRKAPDGSAVEIARLIPNHFYWVEVCPRVPLNLCLQVASTFSTSSFLRRSGYSTTLSRIRTDRHLKRAKLHPTRCFATYWNGSVGAASTTTGESPCTCATRSIPNTSEAFGARSGRCYSTWIVLYVVNDSSLPGGAIDAIHLLLSALACHCGQIDNRRESWTQASVFPWSL